MSRERPPGSEPQPEVPGLVAPPAVPQVRGPRRGAQGPLARENQRGFPPEATMEIRETRAGVEEIAPHDTLPLSPESRARGSPKGPTNSYDGVSRTWGRTCGTTSSPPTACVTASSAMSRKGLTVSLSDWPGSLLTRLLPLAIFVTSRAGTRKIMKRQLLLLPKVPALSASASGGNMPPPRWPLAVESTVDVDSTPPPPAPRTWGWTPHAFWLWIRGNPQALGRGDLEAECGGRAHKLPSESLIRSSQQTSGFSSPSLNPRELPHYAQEVLGLALASEPHNLSLPTPHCHTRPRGLQFSPRTRTGLAAWKGEEAAGS